MSLADKYEKSEWWLRLLGGTALYILLLQAFSQFIGQNTVSIFVGGQYTTDYFFLNPPLLYYFLGLGIFVFLTPFLLSLALTKRDVELRNLTVVPPLTIGLLGILYAVVFIFGFPNLHLSPAEIPLEADAYLFGFLGILLLVGTLRLEDRLIVALLGRATEREAIYFEDMSVSAPIERVKERFSVPEIQSALRLSPRIEGNADLGYEMKTPRGFDFIIRLKVLRDAQLPHILSVVKIVIYERTRYSVKSDSYFVEYAQKQAGYILDFLNHRTPPLSASVTTPLTNSSQDPFVDEIIDDMRGLYLKSQKYSLGDKVKLTALIGIVALTGLLFAAGFTTYGIVSAVIDVLFALNDLPDVISRRQT